MPKRVRLSSIAANRLLRDSPPAFGALTPWQERLGCHHDLVAVREFGQQATDDFFRRALGIHVGGVEEVDPGFHRLADEGAAFVFAQNPIPMPALGRVAIAHAAEAQARDLEAGRSKINVLHVRLSHPASCRHRRSASGRRRNRPMARRETAPLQPCPAVRPNARAECLRWPSSGSVRRPGIRC